MNSALPPITKLAERLMLDIEQAVSGFARKHRYGTGEDLRTEAKQVARLCNRAWRDKARRSAWVDELVWAIDELKFTLQLGSQLRAFHSFGQFEALIRIAEDLGRQAGGWKRNHPKGQNSPPQQAPERAQILSTRGASQGAHP